MIAGLAKGKSGKMSKKKTAKDNTAAVAKTSDQPKKRLFNVEKRFGYTMHEIWTHKMSYGLVAPFFILFITFSLLPLLASARIPPVE